MAGERLRRRVAETMTGAWAPTRPGWKGWCMIAREIGAEGVRTAVRIRSCAGSPTA